MVTNSGETVLRTADKRVKDVADLYALLWYVTDYTDVNCLGVKWFETRRVSSSRKI
ncbi:Uncharacterized protein AArcCO_0436 [Halalkaliarchaeum sp. AArc-CO]|nr:Uncharacterized protein AArcCO_0436 [Halalkaliarchaeum sp. AArc-CO]